MNKQIAQHLLDIGAVTFSPNELFTYTSGIKSPIYCDNRLTLSYPHIRREISQAFENIILEKYPEVEVIAGTATAGIPHAAWVSERLDVPMVYVRGNAKSYGKKRQIEGLVKEKQKVVVIEDLFSTGGSSIQAAEILRSNGVEVLGIVAILTYELKEAEKMFRRANLDYHTITDYSTLLELVKLTKEERAVLDRWHINPSYYSNYENEVCKV